MHTQRQLPVAAYCALMALILLLGCSLHGECQALKLHPHPASFARRFRGYQPSQVATTNMLCQKEGEECNPFTNECCVGTVCLGYRGDFCNHKMERCVCLPEALTDYGLM